MVGFKCSECGSYNTVRCGNEEIPECPEGGGVMGEIRRVGRAPQGDGDDETGGCGQSSTKLFCILSMRCKINLGLLTLCILPMTKHYE